MPNLTVQTKPNLAGYAELKRRVRETLISGQRRIEAERVRTYWETGYWIREHIFLNGGRGDYGERVIFDLSRDIEIDGSVLSRCERFVEKFPRLFPRPILATWPKSSKIARQIEKIPSKNALNWSHYRLLLPVKDGKDRERLAAKASREGWVVERLKTEIQKSGISRKRGLQDASGSSPSERSDLLVPKKGSPGLYEIFEEEGILFLDLGFTSYVDLTKDQSKDLKSGDLVRLDKDGMLVKDPQAKSAQLYTYPARVRRVIDGDTYWMRIDLIPISFFLSLWGRRMPVGRPPVREAGTDRGEAKLEKTWWLKEKLRLRGVDTPELNTAKGRAAKRFVESLFKKTESVLLTTTKPDKWDRYLSDIFLTMPDGKEIYLNNLLLEKGYARRKDRFDLTDWEK